jgi:uncharacterized protein (DUF433 family)
LSQLSCAADTLQLRYFLRKDDGAMAFEKSTALQHQPAYRVAEVAQMLVLPMGTVKAWCFGQDYVHRDGRAKRFAKLIDVADAKQKLLSFSNLCELHVLAAMRRSHRLPMPVVRNSLNYVARQLGQARPLIAGEFKTNGISLFLERAGSLVNVSEQGQTALRGDFESALSRIDRDQQGMPVRLFPFTRTAPFLAQQPPAVVIDPQLAFGRPALTRGGVTTAVVEDRFCAGDSPAEMAQDYGVAEADILEAIRFEQRRVA